MELKQITTNHVVGLVFVTYVTVTAGKFPAVWQSSSLGKGSFLVRIWSGMVAFTPKACEATAICWRRSLTTCMARLQLASRKISSQTPLLNFSKWPSLTFLRMQMCNVSEDMLNTTPVLTIQYLQFIDGWEASLVSRRLKIIIMQPYYHKTGQNVLIKFHMMPCNVFNVKYCACWILNMIEYDLISWLNIIKHRRTHQTQSISSLFRKEEEEESGEVKAHHFLINITIILHHISPALLYGDQS